MDVEHAIIFMDGRVVQTNFMNVVRQQQRYRAPLEAVGRAVQNFRAGTVDDQAELREIVVMKRIMQLHMFLHNKKRQPAFSVQIVIQGVFESGGEYHKASPSYRFVCIVARIVKKWSLRPQLLTVVFDRSPV
ncbi:MAG: hypothetical protein K0R28_2258 [Paenibacillus sp.]|nr:hypothetical protein [Paenibacillus sp.]